MPAPAAGRGPSRPKRPEGCFGAMIVSLNGELRAGNPGGRALVFHPFSNELRGRVRWLMLIAYGQTVICRWCGTESLCSRLLMK